MFNHDKEMSMTSTRNYLMGLCMAAAALGAAAQTAGEHKGHQPADAARPGAATKAPAKPMHADKMAAMDQHMKAMRAMHDKMTAAKTPEQRQALMAEHMKLMHEGVGMMGGGMPGMGHMHGGKGMQGTAADRQKMMEKRMEMMESIIICIIEIGRAHV